MGIKSSSIGCRHSVKPYLYDITLGGFLSVRVHVNAAKILAALDVPGPKKRIAAEGGLTITEVHDEFIAVPWVRDGTSIEASQALEALIQPVLGSNRSKRGAFSSGRLSNKLRDL